MNWDLYVSHFSFYFQKCYSKTFGATNFQQKFMLQVFMQLELPMERDSCSSNGSSPPPHKTASSSPLKAVVAPSSPMGPPLRGDSPNYQPVDNNAYPQVSQPYSCIIYRRLYRYLYHHVHVCIRKIFLLYAVLRIETPGCGTDTKF
jgi:hypothetical protein